MQSKRRWTDAVWDTIDFELFGQQCRRLAASDQTFRTKLVHDQLPRGKINLQRSSVKDSHVSMCPCCRTNVEDMTHFFRYGDNHATTKGIHDFLQDKTSPEPHPLCRILHGGISSWQKDPTAAFTPDLSSYPVEVRQSIEMAIDSQQAIGWDNAIWGYLSKFWTDFAARELSTTGSPNVSVGRERMRRTIQRLHDIVKDIWFS